ncbi:hypothetical protein HAX54_006967 [Datura stramonium]|uniref:Uncharacterized protein n=1 Tax=Datura stramonium TaxID=4076 RepID=A0ABS8TCG7_DATST|nr:hypothetical protein [Datura stramonium]
MMKIEQIDMGLKSSSMMMPLRFGEVYEVEELLENAKNGFSQVYHWWSWYWHETPLWRAEIEKIQAELRQEYDVLEENRRKLEFQEKDTRNMWKDFVTVG